MYGSNPDATFAHESVANLDQLVYLSTTLNTGHAHGLAKETIILPVLARDEEPEPTTQESMFNYVRLSDGGSQRFLGARSEIDVISTLAEGVVGIDGPIDWREWMHTETIRSAIGRIVPGYEAISTIGSTKKEFHIEGRTFHSTAFPMPDGRARFHMHTLPSAIDSSGINTLRLMTIRSEGQFNTVVYEDDDVYRGIRGRDVILLHPTDAKKIGLQPEDTVRISGPGGEMEPVRVKLFENIRAGSAAMYFPEANAVLSRHVDPLSRTPAFKGARISIIKT